MEWDGPVRTPLAIKRAAKRTKLTAEGRLLTATGERPVRLRDLSRAGACGEMPGPPAQASEVVLVCGTIVVPAGVAWVVGQRFGLEFRQLIGSDDVRALASRNVWLTAGPAD